MRKKGPKKEKKDLERKVSEWKDKYLRALADYQNLEKQIVKSKQEQEKIATIRVIREILPVVDDLKRVSLALDDQGLQLVLQEFQKILEQNKIEKIEVIDRRFDPHIMECIEVVDKDGKEIVVEEVRPGYRRGDEVIRVAQVKVGKSLGSTESQAPNLKQY